MIDDEPEELKGYIDEDILNEEINKSKLYKIMKSDSSF